MLWIESLTVERSCEYVCVLTREKRDCSYTEISIPAGSWTKLYPFQVLLTVRPIFSNKSIIVNSYVVLVSGRKTIFLDEP